MSRLSVTPLILALTLVGIALGGFFDGILLHQILQWHHLLSLVDGLSMREQVLFDGFFHSAHYVLLIVGLIIAWRHRPSLGQPSARHILFGAAALGFGLWHLVDALLSHWLLGIHRIRVDAADPLLWDLGWLLLFGLGPMALGAWLLGRKPGGSRLPSPLVLVLLAPLAGLLAAMPPRDGAPVIVVFADRISDGQAISAIIAAGGAPLSRTSGIWRVRWDDGAAPLRLYASGALFVGGGIGGVGCGNWTRV